MDKMIAEVMRNIGSKHILVVHSEDGLDEISCASRTLIVELKNGAISESVIGPDDFGMNKVSLNSLVSKNETYSANAQHNLLDHQWGRSHRIFIFIDVRRARSAPRRYNNPIKVHNYVKYAV